MPILLLSLLQKLTEQGMVKVNHGHQNSVKVTVLLSHVHGQVSLRYRHLLLPIHRVATHGYITRPGFSTAQSSRSVCQPPAPGEEFRDGLGPARRRVYPAVSGSGPRIAEDPSGGPDQPFSELEASDLSHVSVFLSETKWVFGRKERGSVRVRWGSRKGPRIGDGHGESGEGEADF